MCLKQLTVVVKPAYSHLVYSSELLPLSLFLYLISIQLETAGAGWLVNNSHEPFTRKMSKWMLADVHDQWYQDFCSSTCCWDNYELVLFTASRANVQFFDPVLWFFTFLHVVSKETNVTTLYMIAIQVVHLYCLGLCSIPLYWQMVVVCVISLGIRVCTLKLLNESTYSLYTDILSCLWLLYVMYNLFAQSWVTLSSVICSLTESVLNEWLAGMRLFILDYLCFHNIIIHNLYNTL